MSRTDELEKAKAWLARLKLSRTDRRTLLRVSDRKRHKDVAAADRIKPSSSRQRLWRANRKIKAAMATDGLAADPIS